MCDGRIGNNQFELEHQIPSMYIPKRSGGIYIDGILSLVFGIENDEISMGFGGGLVEGLLGFGWEWGERESHNI